MFRKFILDLTKSHKRDNIYKIAMLVFMDMQEHNYLHRINNLACSKAEIYSALLLQKEASDIFVNFDLLA